MKLHQRQTNLSQNDQLDTIWSIVEARHTFPALIAVAAATDGDDTTSIARGLAQAACSAGQSAAYLRLTAGNSASADAGSYAELSLAPRASKREAFDAALQIWRTMYDVVIVDIGNVHAEPVAAHVVRVAAGVVVGVCAERRVMPGDRRFRNLLAQLDAAVIGVVLSAPVPRVRSVRKARDRSRLATAPQQ